MSRRGFAALIVAGAVAGSIPDDKFSLDWEKARSIWDSDSKKLIKGGVKSRG